MTDQLEGEHDLREENRRLRELLGRLEWAGGTYCDESACANYECGRTPREGHDPGCWLAAEIASSQPAKGKGT